jgi:Arc/MetJ-type ribon-helix-helix transcriptional regulator
MTTLHIALPPDLQEYLQQQLKGSAFKTPSDYVAALLRQDQAQRAEYQRRLAELRQEINIALEQSARGESRPLDIEEIMAAGRKRLAETLQQR